MRFYTPQVDRDHEAWAQIIDRTADFRVLRRLPHLEELWVAPTPRGGPAFRIAVVDSETTGISETDELIEIAVVRMGFDGDGQLCEIEPPLVQLEAPSRPLSAEVKELTGLTDDILIGRRFDERELAAAVGDVDAIVAHNARFDARFWRNRFAGLRHPWACSQRDIDWPALGVRGQSLTALLGDRGFFYSAHRAASDAWAVAMLLIMPGPDGRALGAHLVDRARRDTFQIQAIQAPYDCRHALKARGYRWIAARRVWAIEVEAERLEQEQAWLRELSPSVRPFAVSVDWYTRHIAD